MESYVPEAASTFRVEEELKAAFSEAAKSQDQTGAQLLRSFMRDYVKRQQDDADYESWFLEKVRPGLDSANAGKLVFNADVEGEFSARREASRQKLAHPCESLLDAGSNHRSGDYLRLYRG
jgi:predicted transcriptional regulator